MYNKSYSGYKNKGFKFKKSYNNKLRVKKKKAQVSPEVVLTRLNIIRYLAIFMVLLIVVGVITTGFIIYRSDTASDQQNDVSRIETEDNFELLRIVNKNKPLDATYVPELAEVDGVYINTLAVNSIKELLTDALRDNVDLKLDVGYVSYKEQNEKYIKEYEKLLNDYNLTSVTAEAKAQSKIPQGGNSEFQTGLLIKFSGDQDKNSFSDSKASQWLEKNCVDYGFVVRYTDEKKSYTMMEGDPSVYRYVGTENAKIMRSLNMCLDEYFNYISMRE